MLPLALIKCGQIIRVHLTCELRHATLHVAFTFAFAFAFAFAFTFAALGDVLRAVLICAATFFFVQFRNARLLFLSPRPPKYAPLW
ncbi:hypothetical protein IE81DRAFT_326028 [Ceraceosorus guamensis]|uniref:Uncharacterized protein n=1 Tax=Ceraceosorus guamensis TaxID=1522189 RepID=A0A316VUK2_9BASI|nr:hypothetical protein IE81DRAFT_326028 [Ceraceosorus guamensis]PWN39941.1 hypothetical protein IE81DRAFT_326028 [Ceraceosorus guamensis]